MSLLPRLRAPVDSDAAALFPLLYRTSVVRNIQWDGPECLESFKLDWSRKVERADAGIGHFFVVLTDSAEPAGVCSLSVDSPNHGGVGFWIGEPFQNAGLATEALAKLVVHSVESLQLDKLVAEVFVGNNPSRRVLEKNGFTLVATNLAACVKLGRPTDVWTFERPATQRPTTS